MGFSEVRENEMSKMTRKIIDMTEFEQMLREFGHLSDGEKLEDFDTKGYSWSDSDRKRIEILVESDEYNNVT